MDTSHWQSLIPQGEGLHAQVVAFLRTFGKEKTIVHVEGVAREARKLAESDGPEMVLLAEQAGWLHDISAVIPNDQRREVAYQWGMPVLPEEEDFPMLLHQGLSAAIALRWFGIQNNAVLSAIGCHTTLKPGASRLDKIVFLADKIAWDQPGMPPFLQGVKSGLEHSLEKAALFYLSYLEETLPRPLHPWARAALAELRQP